MRRHRKGEIIWRVTYQIDATADNPRPEPVILILADKMGWEQLAKEFTKMSKRKVSKDMIAVGDSEDHQHIRAAFFPMINKVLSHQLELRLGLLTPQTRAKVLRKYSLAKAPNSDADMRTLFRRLVKDCNKQIRQINW